MHLVQNKESSTKLFVFESMVLTLKKKNCEIFIEKCFFSLVVYLLNHLQSMQFLNFKTES